MYFLIQRAIEVFFRAYKEISVEYQRASGGQRRLPRIVLYKDFINRTEIYTKISLTELVNGLVLLMLPIYFNSLERTTVRVSLAICE